MNEIEAYVMFVGTHAIMSAKSRGLPSYAGDFIAAYMSIYFIHRVLFYREALCRSSDARRAVAMRRRCQVAVDVAVAERSGKIRQRQRNNLLKQ